MSTVSGGWDGPAIVKDGLVLYLDAGSPNSFYPLTAGTTWKDISGNTNNGTLTNGPTYNSANGGSIVFDGADDTLLGSSTSALISNNFTLQVTIKPDTITSGNFSAISDFQFSYSGRNGFYLGLDNRPAINVANTVFISIGADNTYLYSAQNSVITNGNNIYIISFVATNGVLSLYVNGTLSAGLSGNNNPGSITYTGTSYNIRNTYKGSWYNYILYNRALSATEILQNYNATKTRFGL